MQKKNKCSVSFFFAKKKQTAFRSAAVVNIAIELRTAAAQAQGAGSRAVHSNVRMDKRLETAMKR